jgi:hypothetical protein|tara:strand:+ start:2243 stop:2674 length:432 start_codon:yes stop_codon:yes gene_type:complete
MAYKSKYKPQNPNKYVGKIENIVCRSTWERKMCKYLDLNENVISWASEELAIPYFSLVDDKWHRYYPDFMCKIKNKSGTIDKLIIEVKPEKQTKPPKAKKQTRNYLREMKTFAINTYKWEAAEKFCTENGWVFKILTEKDLFR